MGIPNGNKTVTGLMQKWHTFIVAGSSDRRFLEEASLRQTGGMAKVLQRLRSVPIGLK
jgi:hypothetical protein